MLGKTSNTVRFRNIFLTQILAFAVCLGSAAGAHATISPADPSKVLRYAFPAAETGFDPAVTSDLYSSLVNQSIFETLFTYDYLARPVKLTTLAAAALPEVSADGKTYTIRLKKGIYFDDDPVFSGKKRELTMADFVYSWKRLFDPKLSSPQTWLLEGKIIGLDELAENARKTGKFDYDASIQGFDIVDPYTLRINLTQPDFNLGMILAHTPTGAVAREVIEKYRDDRGAAMAHPVGTGPYVLREWVRGSRIVLTASPQYRGYTWDFQPGRDPGDADIVARMKGKRMPQIGRVEISIMVESQSSFLAFEGDEVDIIQIGGTLAPKVLTDGKLRPEFVKRGVQLSRIADPGIVYNYWNMQDPVVGGMGVEKIALRRAIAMAQNVREQIRVVMNGEAIPLEYPIPPGIVGHDPAYRSSIQYEPEAANALLDRFGYKIGKDGYRTLPDGKPLTIRYTTSGSASGQQALEIVKRTYDSLKIRMTGELKPFPDFLKAQKQCQLQASASSWVADYPDGDNFMQLFYGKNVGVSNNFCGKIPAYDSLYAESQKLPAGPERDVLFHKMARVLEAVTPMRVGYAAYRNMIAQPRVIGFRKHPILATEWMYFDIEKRP